MKADDLDDQQLAARANQGDRDALGALLAKNGPLIRRHLKRYRFDPSAQNDVFQDVMLQVVRKLHLFRGDSLFSTWLFRVVANTSLMHLRTLRRRRETHDDADLEGSKVETSIRPPPSLDLPDRQLERERRNFRVERAMSDLSPGARHLVVEHYLEERPLRDIADDLGLSEPAVRTRLHRARCQLRDALATDIEAAASELEEP